MGDVYFSITYHHFMLRFTLLLLFAAICRQTCFSQSKVFITAEAGWSDDHFAMNDPGHSFLVPDAGSGYFGVSVGKMLKKHLYVETGIYTRKYSESIQQVGSEGPSGGSGRRFAQIPLRVGGRWEFFGKRVAVRPYGGVVINITGKNDRWPSWFDYGPGTGPLLYTYKFRYPTDVFALAQAGMTLEYRIAKKMYLGVSSSYNWGFEKMMIQDISYTLNGNAQKATSSSRGGFNSITASVSFRLGK